MATELHTTRTQSHTSSAEHRSTIAEMQRDNDKQMQQPFDQISEQLVDTQTHLVSAHLSMNACALNECMCLLVSLNEMHVPFSVSE